MRKLLYLVGAAALVGLVTPASAQMNMSGGEHAARSHHGMSHGMMAGMMKHMRGMRGNKSGGMCSGCTSMCSCCSGMKHG